MSAIQERLALVRGSMAGQGLDAFLAPRADEYLGEYVPPQNERLKWLTGFTGSAGMAVVRKDSAALFVDGRYTLQAPRQAPAACFDFHHLIEEPPIKWLADKLPKGAKVGVDTRMHSLAWFKASRRTLARKSIELVPVDENPIDQRWQDRPAPACKPALLLAAKYTGEASVAKRRRLAVTVREAGAHVALITQLDSIAWLLNIRGADVPRLPVLLGFAILGADASLALFTDPRKLPKGFAAHVGKGVAVEPSQRLPAALDALGKQGKKVLADPATANAWCQLRCKAAGAKLIAGDDPALLPKAQKNKTEVAGIKRCHVRDGAAVTRCLAWLDREVAAGRLPDEAQAASQMEAFRQEAGGLHDLAFDTISAAGANGAIVHYNHLDSKPARMKKGSLYLVDSGGQYPDGTTDITRTVAIGKPSAEHRRMFTLVLKGHIALAQAVFPKGTSGVQLDALARQFLWQAGHNYDHGTGHGVGAFLSVHEGPQRISPSGSQQELLPGMVISNEPGYYKPGRYGIRCENLVLVRERKDGMRHFETITLAPFDRRLIEPSLLTPTERAWLNAYHTQVRQRLGPRLPAKVRPWLTTATQEV